jgi:hypothetical protein
MSISVGTTSDLMPATSMQSMLPEMCHPLVNQPTETTMQLLDRYDNIYEDPAEAVLILLVAVYTSLSSEDYAKLALHLWDRFIIDRERKAFSPASFLFIECTEKVPEVVKELFSKDLYRYEKQNRF